MMRKCENPHVVCNGPESNTFGPQVHANKKSGSVPKVAANRRASTWPSGPRPENTSRFLFKESPTLERSGLESASQRILSW